VLDGPVEVFDAAKDQLRFEIAGSENVATFAFPAAGAAASVDIGGTTFARR